MNKEKEKRRLKSKLQRLQVLKLSLEGTVREITDEIICTEKDLAQVEVGKVLKKKKQVDISSYVNGFYAEFERYRQR